MLTQHEVDGHNRQLLSDGLTEHMFDNIIALLQECIILGIRVATGSLSPIEKKKDKVKMRNVRIDEAGHLVVKNLSAWWIPEIRIERKIHGTVYTVTGSFEGNEFLEKKLTRILLKNVEDAK